jgi:hypothetical protein
MEGHPESSISSKNQQFEPPQVVAQAWTPIHIHSRFAKAFSLAAAAMMAAAGKSPITNSRIVIGQAHYSP